MNTTGKPQAYWYAYIRYVFPYLERETEYSPRAFPCDKVRLTAAALLYKPRSNNVEARTQLQPFQDSKDNTVQTLRLLALTTLHSEKSTTAQQW